MRRGELEHMLDGGPSADAGTLRAIVARRDRHALRRLRAATVSSMALAAAALAGGATALATGALVTSGSSPPVASAPAGKTAGPRSPSLFSTARSGTGPAPVTPASGSSGGQRAKAPGSSHVAASPSSTGTAAGVRGCGGVFGTVVARLEAGREGAHVLVVTARVVGPVRRVGASVGSGAAEPLTPAGGWVVLVRTLAPTRSLPAPGERVELRAYGTSGDLLASLEVPGEPYTASSPTCSR